MTLRQDPFDGTPGGHDGCDAQSSGVDHPRRRLYCDRGDRALALSTWRSFRPAPAPREEAAEVRLQVNTPPTTDPISMAVSPDGRWIAYQSNEGGPLQVYVQPFPGSGGKQQISTAGGSSPRWASASRELFFLSLDAKPWRRQSLFAGRPWTPEHRWRCFARSSVEHPVSAGNIRPQYDVAADGRFLMNVTTEDTTSPITVILNWKPK